MQDIIANNIHVGDNYFPARTPPKFPIYKGIPSKHNFFLGRDNTISELVGRLISGQYSAFSIVGLPGVGKTALSIELANHPEIRKYFADGVLWAGLGQAVNPLQILSGWADYLGQDVSDKLSIEERAQVVADAISERKMLIVIDDAWDIETANYLRCGSTKCCHLLTTRDNWIGRTFANSDSIYVLPEMNDDEAHQVLFKLAPEVCETDQDKVRTLIGYVGGLPLALRLLGGYLSAPQHSMFPNLSQQSLNEMMDPRIRLQLAEKRLGTTSGNTITLERTVALSLDGLSEQAITAFYKLGVFAPKPAHFSLDAAKYVTEADESIIAFLISRNLVEYSDIQRPEREGYAWLFQLPQEKELYIHRIIFDVAQAHLSQPGMERQRSYYLSWIKELKTKSPPRLLSFFDDNFQQIERVWALLPEDNSLLDWLEVGQFYFVLRNLWQEYISWANRALSMTQSRNLPREEGVLLAEIGRAYNNLHQWDEAVKFSERALPILDKVGDQVGYARTLHNIAVYWVRQRRITQKVPEYLLQAVSIMAGQDDLLGIEACIMTLAEALKLTHNWNNQTRALIDSFRKDLEENRKDEKIRLRQANYKGVGLAILVAGLSAGPIALEFINALIKSNQAVADFKGDIVIGVRFRKQGKEITRCLRAIFYPGMKAKTEYLDAIPENADLILILSDLSLVLLISSPVDWNDLEIYDIRGDRNLFSKLASYLNPTQLS